MLRQFSRMIEAALPRMRDSHSTLGRELSLAVAYLSVQKIRMGTRLQFSVDVPENLRGSDLPPMMLSTLVENAIKHGLAPLRHGGRVHIAAAVERDILRVYVADTGRGLAESCGDGVGLANIESRLAAMFGKAAGLSLEPNVDGGVTASIELPRRISYRDAGAIA